MGTHMIQGWAAVFGGFLVHLTLGTIYSIGNMVPYVISYTRAYSHPDTVDYSDGTWIFAFALVGQGCFMFIGGLIYKKLGPRWTTMIGSAITSLGILLTYFSLKVSFIMTVLTYGFVFGAGVGIAYAPPLACAMKWLPERKGLVNGIVLAGFGGGAFVFSQIQSHFVNPTNLAPDLVVDDERYFSAEEAEELLHRVPYTFLLMGGIFVIMQFVGCMLLSSPKQQPCCPNEEKEPLIGGEDQVIDTRTLSMGDLDRDSQAEPGSGIQSPVPADLILDQNERETIPDVHPFEMLKTRAFYTLWCLFLVNGQAVIFVSTLYKAYGQTFISNDLFLTYVGAFASIFNAGGRPCWGYLADRFGFRYFALPFLSCEIAIGENLNVAPSKRLTMLGLCTSMIIFMMTLIATPSGGEVMFFIWICAIFLTFSGNFALFPTVTAKTFGQKYVAVNFGLVFTSQLMTGLVGALLTTTLEQYVGWFGMFCIVSAFSAIGWILAMSFNYKRNGRDI